MTVNWFIKLILFGDNERGENNENFLRCHFEHIQELIINYFFFLICKNFIYFLEHLSARLFERRFAITLPQDKKKGGGEVRRTKNQK